jgi:hypothetical protein
LCVGPVTSITELEVPVPVVKLPKLFHVFWSLDHWTWYGTLLLANQRMAAALERPAYT